MIVCGVLMCYVAKLPQWCSWTADHHLLQSREGSWGQFGTMGYLPIHWNTALYCTGLHCNMHCIVLALLHIMQYAELHHTDLAPLCYAADNRIKGIMDASEYSAASMKSIVSSHCSTASILIVH